MKQLCLLGVVIFSLGMFGCGNQYKGLLGHDEGRDEHGVDRDIDDVEEIEIRRSMNETKD